MARVLIAGFCAVPSPDRSGVQMRHVLDALVEHHAVDVLVLRRDEQAYVERHGTARVLRVPLHDDAPRSQVETFRRALRRQLEGADYDVVQFRDGWAGIPVLELRERLGYAAVFDAGRSPLAEPALMRLDLSSELERDHEACLIGADLVLAASEPARRFLAERGRPDRVFMVPPGVDVDRFDWDYPPTTGAPRVLMVGTIEPGRGVRVLLRAMVDIAARSPARLTLAGRIAPTFAHSLRQAIADLGLRDRVELLGAIDHRHIPALIATATVCVAPAAVELSPRPLGLYPTKLLEYMACRRPVVAPRRGTVGMVVKDGVNGLTFTAGDPTDLARAVLTLLGRPELRQRLSDAGYELVRRHHTASSTRRALRVAYAALSGRAPWEERFADVPTDPVASLPTEPREPIEELEVTDFDAVPAPPAPERSEPVTVAADITRVDARARGPERDSGEWAAMSGQPRGDEWMVTQPHRALPDPGPLRDDDEGTPVDVAVRAPSAPPTENRFVAGEIMNSGPEPEMQEPTFTAASVLLGSTGETPAPERREPGDDDPTPGPTPVGAIRDPGDR